MPRDITITFADGTQHVYKGAPDDVTPEAVQARAAQEFGKPIAGLDGGRGAAPKKERSYGERVFGMASPGKLLASLATPEGREDIAASAVGTARGVKDVIDTGAEWMASGYDRLASGDEAGRVNRMNAAGKADFSKEYGGDSVATGARIGGNVAATWPVGGVLGVGAKALGLERLAAALTSGGATTGAKVGPTLAARTGDMGIRMAGGGVAGGASAALIDPNAAVAGTAAGVALPPVARFAGAAGDLAASLVRPFTKGGQSRIVGDTLRQFSTNPEAAANMGRAAEVVPGSAPTAMQAAGDEGLSGLARSLQSADPRFAAELASRGGAQNAARTAALEEVAGNTGKLALAREGRDAATGAMRETVLDAAGRLPARPVLDSIDRLLAKPDNAGELAQQALGKFRTRIAQFAPDGQIDARALYAIRKDINQMLEGKLQGEAGNLRYAAGQLRDVKGVIDSAIDQASRRVDMSTSRALMPQGANIERAGMAPPPSAGPRPTWGGYLQEYSNRSVPINQMERLDDVLKSISTGTVDKSGNAVLSAAKLNNLLRNQAQELQQVLAPEQLDLLRRLAADLNASQLAANSGRAVGSNTVQNMAGTNVLMQALGGKVGGSALAQTTMGRLLQLPYGASNKMLQDRLGAALLDPKEAARLMATPEGNALMRALTGGAGQVGYRAAPALAAQ